MLLTGRNLSKHYGPRLLFSGATFGLFRGEKFFFRNDLLVRHELRDRQAFRLDHRMIAVAILQNRRVIDRRCFLFQNLVHLVNTFVAQAYFDAQATNGFASQYLEHIPYALSFEIVQRPTRVFLDLSF